MKEMSSVKRACICAVCIALCYVLPLAFHAFGAGTVFLPMHIPVLLCGLICGWGYGAFCGIAGPVLSCVLSGMPSATGLVSMVPELCAYGLVSGLLLRCVHTKHTYADLYLALIAAMLGGRVIWGIVRVILSGVSGSAFTWAAFMSGAFINAVPGIIVHIVLIPVIVMALERALPWLRPSAR